MCLHIGSVDVVGNILVTVFFGVAAVVIVTVKEYAKNCQHNISKGILL